MKRMILAVAALAATVASAPASEVGRRTEILSPTAVRNQIEDRWTGRWVVTRTETRSDCAGVYTDNLASGPRVASRGRQRFVAGTPARVDSVDVTRSQISLRLTLSEVLLVTRTYRDITLRDEARCQVDLKIIVPPGLFEGADLMGLDGIIELLIDRYRNEESALLASNFLPVDDPVYATERAEAVAAHQEWKVEQASRAYEARMSQWVSQTTRLSGQISTDPDYLDGFARGVEAGRAGPARACADIVRNGPAVQVGGPVAAHAAKGRRQKNWARGYEDGVRLTQGLQAIQLMPQCAPSAAPPPRRGPDLPATAKLPARPATVVPAATTSGQ